MFRGCNRYIRPECRARFQDIVDNEAAQTAAANASEPHAEMREQAVGGSASSSSSGPAQAAGRTAPDDANMEPAESSAQPTSSLVRTMEAEDGTSAKRQKLMAGMPILHETDVDVNMDAHEFGCFGGDARRPRKVDSAGH